MAEGKEEKLRLAFERIRQDIDFLKQEINHIKQDLGELVHFLDRPAHTPPAATRQETAPHRAMVYYHPQPFQNDAWQSLVPIV